MAEHACKAMPVSVLHAAYYTYVSHSMSSQVAAALPALASSQLAVRPWLGPVDPWFPAICAVCGSLS
jgi:hypothetical protein